jgi:hypothetical protein
MALDSRPVGSARRWNLAVGLVAGLNAVAALGGAVGLVSGWLALGDLTERLPFGSAVLGGVALFLLVCVPQALLTWFSVRRSSATAATSLVVGSLLVAWIVVEVAFLQVLAGLQIAYLLIGFVQIGLGILLGEHEPGIGPRALAAMAWAEVADLPRPVLTALHRPH